jgi:hypothetical protein
MKSFDFTLFDADGAEHKYTVNEHPASEGLKLQVKLLTLFLPFTPLCAFALDVIDSQKADADWIPQLKEVITTDLIGSLHGEEIAEMFKLITKYAARDGKSLTAESYEIIFAGNYGELYELVWRVIRGNFSSVLSIIKKKIQEKKEKERTKENSAKSSINT